MSNDNSKIGWIIGVIVVIIFGVIIINNNSKTNSTTNTYQTTYSTPKTTTTTTTTPKYVTPEVKTETITWHCVDVTSYNQNAYDDNLCTSNTGEVRYTSDSQAVSLDPSYSPGKSGAYYYNNK